MSEFVNVVIARLTGVGGELDSVEIDTEGDSPDVISGRIKQAIINADWDLAPGDTITIEEGDAEIEPERKRA